jgi:hypothetical protein
MPLNIPTGSVNNIGFGPARVFMKTWTATGSTPSLTTDDVGFIGEDGVNVELTSEKKDITQGNPKLVNYSFVMSQSATISFSSIQWDFDNFSRALGAGATGTTSTVGAATTSTFAFGGNPLNTFVAMTVQHEMAQSGNTILLYVWKAQSESGFNVPFGADEHSFDFSFKAIQALTDWGGTALSTEEQLIRFVRISTT